MKFSTKSMQVHKINYIIQDKSRYFTADQRVSRYPWLEWLWVAPLIRRFTFRRSGLKPPKKNATAVTLIRLIRLSFDKEQWFWVRSSLSDSTAKNLSSNIWWFFPAFVVRMLMIIKNITSLTGLQILGRAGASGNNLVVAGAGGIRWILDFGFWISDWKTTIPLCSWSVCF